MTEYAGIDYSLGRSNRNMETGIHFGVISQNSVNLDVLSEIQSAGADYGKPTCPECSSEVVSSDHETVPDDADWNEGKDFACVSCEVCYWSDQVYGEEMIGWSHDADGYKLTDCLDTDIFILESPYYTMAQYCSPCVPGAGNLDSPCANGPKTYALGHDWFEGGKAPYPLYSVETGLQVQV